MRSLKVSMKRRMVMMSDILPTGHECGVLNGQVKPGDTVAIVGGGTSRACRVADRPVLLTVRNHHVSTWTKSALQLQTRNSEQQTR